MKQNLIQEKSFQFAIHVVKVYQKIVKDKKEYVISKQMLRAGTSVGANVEEAIGGQSEKDFMAKLTIAYKEARETQYWARLLLGTGYLEEEEGRNLLDESESMKKIISSILLTMKNRLNQNP